MTHRTIARPRRKHFYALVAAWAAGALLAQEAGAENPARENQASAGARDANGVPLGALPQEAFRVASPWMQLAQAGAKRSSPEADEPVPASRDELFGEPAAGAKRSSPKAEKPVPASRDELFGAPAAGAKRSSPEADEPVPASRDELFGEPAAGAKRSSPKADKPAPASRDELFGEPAAAEDSSSYKIGGFVDGLGAYTYAAPAHWSRAVARFQVTAQGAFNENLKWKIGGRADVDPIYFGSDFYLDAVKHDQRLSAFWGENYLDFSAGDWNFRLGAQQIVWGEVVGLFYADVVSARDMREFLLPSFDIMRIPQAAARAEYFAGDSHVEFVWIPVATFDRIGKPGSDFYPAPIPSPTSPVVAALFQNPDRPARTLSNSNYGVRANTLAAGWDVAAFYYRSFSTQPTFYRTVSSDPTQPFVFAPRYDRIWQTGGTVSKDFGEFVLRAETVYAHGQGYSVADLTAPQSVVERNTLDSIVSLDFTLPADIHLNVQGFDRAYFGGGGTDLAIRSDGVGASILLSKKFGSAFEPQILWIQNFREAGGLIRPRLNWYPAKNTSVGVGVDVFTGPSDGFFGRYNNRDRLYAELRRDF